MRELTNLVNDLLGFSNVDWSRAFENDFFRNNAFGTFSKNLNKNLDDLFSDLREDSVKTSYKTYYDKETSTYKVEYTASSVLTEEARTRVMRKYITVWNAFALTNHPEKVKLTFAFVNKDSSVKKYVFFYTKEKRVFECAADSTAPVMKNLKLDCVKFIYQAPVATSKCHLSEDRPTAKFSTYAEALRRTLKERKSCENIDVLCQEIKFALDNEKFLAHEDSVKLSVSDLSHDSLVFRSKFGSVDQREFENALTKTFGFSKAVVNNNDITLYF